MWMTLTQTDGQKIAINFNTVKIMLPTVEGTDIAFVDGTSAYVKERMVDVTKRLDGLRDYMRGA